MLVLMEHLKNGAIKNKLLFMTTGLWLLSDFFITLEWLYFYKSVHYNSRRHVPTGRYVSSGFYIFIYPYTCPCGEYSVSGKIFVHLLFVFPLPTFRTKRQPLIVPKIPLLHNTKVEVRRYLPTAIVLL